VILIRFRFGLSVTDELPPRCALCGVQGIVDEFGLHSLNCTLGGRRYVIHNALRDALYRICAESLWSPRLEFHPFATAPTLRLDIVVSSGPAVTFRRFTLIDVTMINPLTDNLIHAASSNVAGGATQAEQHKRDHYEEHAVRCHFKLVPFVLDMYGALGTSARALLAELARAWAPRHGVTFNQASTIIAGRIVTRAMIFVARQLLDNTTPSQRVPSEPICITI
jgi:hypothetical protein